MRPGSGLQRHRDRVFATKAANVLGVLSILKGNPEARDWLFAIGTMRKPAVV
ncbi:hypothetical protein RSSM_06567 [Rhodopirellula sallentina SM41]|uniref:Uncharacterized protein n=1 Tax=Rhodopirellula sallentina SM41 TaxID=1263870 RepID=M5TS37_9BACT|nr:hypothetical protein RSSM_06567 [Rhodopirellula sallentina SM41]